MESGFYIFECMIIGYVEQLINNAQMSTKNIVITKRNSYRLSVESGLWGKKTTDGLDDDMHFWWKIKWQLEVLGALQIMGKTAPLEQWMVLSVGCCFVGTYKPQMLNLSQTYK